MANVQKHNTSNNIPSSQTFKSYFDLLFCMGVKLYLLYYGKE
jgi:hypothetical protein